MTEDTATDPSPKTTGIDRSKTYTCRAGCGFETTWPAALGRHESARHGAASPKVEVIGGHNGAHGRPKRLPEKAARPVPMDKFARLLDEVGKQQDELLAALKKVYLLALADRDMRARETEQIRTDLGAVYELLERNRQARQQRIAALVR